MEARGQRAIPFVLCAFLTAMDSGAQAQDALNSVKATRISSRLAPTIDGYLTESIWQSAGLISFPENAADCFTMNFQSYQTTDPSYIMVRFLHDDINLYVGVESNDQMIESSDYDQNADGLAGLALERKSSPSMSMFRLMWHQETQTWAEDSSEYVEAGPPLDRDRMVADAVWAAALLGSSKWNDNVEPDDGYSFEFAIPLNDCNDPSGFTRTGLGGWVAGESFLANLILVDHDSKPGAAYNDEGANFRKCWWGDDTAEDLSIERWITLDEDDPIGGTSDATTITARNIIPEAAPIIDGVPDETIWSEAERLQFPNPAGQFFIPGPSQSLYNKKDPSLYSAFFLHDDQFLYVAITANDAYIESAAYDQASDGLTSLVFEKKDGGDFRISSFWSILDQWEVLDREKPIMDCDGSELTSANLHFLQGPPRYPYQTEKITWGYELFGTLDNSTDSDSDYSFEFRIPLQELGWSSGERIPVNIVLIDHDSNPGGTYNNPQTQFRKLWWGFDGNEFYPETTPGIRRSIPSELERFVLLDDGSPVGDIPDSASPEILAVRAIANAQVAGTGLLRSFPSEPVALLRLPTLWRFLCEISERQSDKGRKERIRRNVIVERRPFARRHIRSRRYTVKSET